VVIMLTAIWYNEYSLITLLLFIGAMALIEFFNMNRLHEKKSLRFMVLLGGLCILLINFLVAAEWINPGYLLADIAIMMVLQILPMLMDKTENFNRTFAFTTSGLGGPIILTLSTAAIDGLSVPPTCCAFSRRAARAP